MYVGVQFKVPTSVWALVGTNVSHHRLVKIAKKNQQRTDPSRLYEVWTEVWTRIVATKLRKAHVATCFKLHKCNLMLCPGVCIFACLKLSIDVFSNVCGSVAPFFKCRRKVCRLFSITELRGLKRLIEFSLLKVSRICRNSLSGLLSTLSVFSSSRSFVHWESHTSVIAV